MKRTLSLLVLALAVGLSTVALDVDAKRLGGAKSSGMQRQQSTSSPAPNNGAAPGSGAAQSGQQAAPAGTAAAAPGAAAPKRSWMGPVAGLAAGLGLAALASHFGFGEALANMMMIGLLAVAVLLVIGFIMRKRLAARNPQLAGATAQGRMGSAGDLQDIAARSTDAGTERVSTIGSRVGCGGTVGAGTQVGVIPSNFDAVAFANNAKRQFMALQAANDGGDVDRLREYLAPEIFEVVRAEIAERGTASQHTEVFGLHAQVLSVVEEGGRYVASVRFTGSVREQHGATPDVLDEVWHLTKSSHDDASGWVIAGIQQSATSNQA